MNRIHAIAFLISLGLAVSASAQDAPPEPTEATEPVQPAMMDDAEALFQRGRDALFRGHYDQAIAILTQAVEADASQTSSLLYLARAYRYAGQPEKSEPLLKEILRQAPDHFEAGQLLAEVYYSREKWQQVLDTLEPLLKYRHDFTTYHLLADAAFNLDEYDKARDYYREAIKLNPKSGPDHYQLGNIYLSENRFALAAQSYEAALSLGLDSAVLHFKLASAYFNLRNYFGRISITTVKSGQPESISRNLYLIEAVPGKKDVFRVAPQRSAVFHIERAIEGGLGDRADTRMLLANIYLNARRYDRAYEMYRTLGDMVPEEEKALYEFYFAQSALGVRKYDEYLQHLREARELAPEAYGSALVDGFLQVAERYNQAGQLEEYIAHLALAVDESPQTTSLHLKLANAYAESRQYQNAVQQWRLVLDLEPDHPRKTNLLNLIRKHQR